MSLVHRKEPNGLALARRAPISLEHAYGEEIKAHARELYVNFAGMSALATERMLEQEARERAAGGETEPYPSARTITRWAKEGSWYADRFRQLIAGNEIEDKVRRVKIREFFDAALDRAIASAQGMEESPMREAASMKTMEVASRLMAMGGFAGGVEEYSLNLPDLLDESEREAKYADETPLQRARRLRYEGVGRALEE